MPIHFGYYATVFLFHSVSNLFVSIALDEFLVEVNVFLGAISAAVSFFLAKSFMRSNLQACLCSLVLMFSGKYFNNATSAEIYMLQTTFTLIGFYLFVKERPLAASIAAFMAALVSPLTIFSFLFFPIVAITKRFDKTIVVKFILPFLLLYGAFFIVMYHGLLWGKRGLFMFSAQASFQPVEAILNYMKYTVKHFHILTPLAMAGLVLGLRRTEILLPTIAIYVPNFFIISRLPGEDQVHILIVDFFLAQLITLGLFYFSGIKYVRMLHKAGLILVLTSFIIFSMYINNNIVHRNNRAYRDEIVHIYTNYLTEKNSVIIASWWDGMALKYYNRGNHKQPLNEGDFADRCYNEELMTSDDRALLLSYDHIYVLEKYNPSRFTEFVLNEAQLMERSKRYSLKSKVERILNARCKEVFSGLLTLYEVQPHPE